MTKTLFLILLIIIIGSLAIWGFILLYKKAVELEDDYRRETREEERAVREALDDYRYEQERQKHLDELKQKSEKTKEKKK